MGRERGGLPRQPGDQDNADYQGGFAERVGRPQGPHTDNVRHLNQEDQGLQQAGRDESTPRQLNQGNPSLDDGWTPPEPFKHEDEWEENWGIQEQIFSKEALIKALRRNNGDAKQVRHLELDVKYLIQVLDERIGDHNTNGS